LFILDVSLRTHDFQNDIGKTPFEILGCQPPPIEKKELPLSPVSFDQLVMTNPSGDNSATVGDTVNYVVQALDNGVSVENAIVFVKAIDPNTNQPSDLVSFTTGIPTELDGGGNGIVTVTSSEGASIGVVAEKPGKVTLMCILYRDGDLKQGDYGDNGETLPPSISGANVDNDYFSLLVTPLDVKPDAQKRPQCEPYFQPEIDGIHQDVYVGSGTFTYQTNLMSIKTRDSELEFVLTYRSDSKNQGPLGPNWDHNHNQRVTRPFKITTGYGRTQKLRGSNFTPIEPPGDFSVGFYEYRDDDPTKDLLAVKRNPGGTREIYDLRTGLLWKKIDRKGNETTYFYDSILGTCVLKSIVDCMGRIVANFQYKLFPANKGKTKLIPQIIGITDYTGRQISLQYNDDETSIGGVSTLRSITSYKVEKPTDNQFSEGKTTMFYYDNSIKSDKNPNLSMRNKMIGIIKPNQVADGSLTVHEEIKYGNEISKPNEFDRVIYQKCNRGDKTRQQYFFYEFDLGIEPGNACGPLWVTVIDPENHKRKYRFDEFGFFIKKIEFEGLFRPNDIENFYALPRGSPQRIFETVYERDVDGRAKKTVDPGGDTIYRYFQLSSGQDILVDRLNKSNLIKKVHEPSSPSDQPKLEEQMIYDPIFQQLREHYTTRYYDEGSGQSGKDHVKFYKYDWEKVVFDSASTNEFPSFESKNLTGDPTIDASFRKIRFGGNLVEEKNFVSNSSLQPQDIIKKKWYNKFGQLINVKDGEGNHTIYRYYPENMPNGTDSTPPVLGFDRQLDANIGGYLEEKIVDDTHETGANEESLSLQSTQGQFPRSPTKISTKHHYDVLGNVTEEIDPRGVTTENFYNERNQIYLTKKAHKIASGTQASLPTIDSIEKRYFFDSNDNMVQINTKNDNLNIEGYSGTSPFKFERTGFLAIGKEYNRDNLETKIIEGIDSNNFRCTKNTYNSNNLLEEEISALACSNPPIDPNNKIKNIYDERDLLFKIIIGETSPDESIETKEYDNNENLVKILDGEGHSTINEFDGYDRLKKVIDAVENEREFTHDASSNVKTVIERGNFEKNGQKKILSQIEKSYDQLNRNYVSKIKFFTYDDNGNEKEITTSSIPGLVTDTTLFDKNNRAIAQINSRGHRVTSFYDGSDRKVISIDHLENEMEEFYDKNDNLIKSIEREKSTLNYSNIENFTSNFEYDALNRITLSKDNLGFTTQKFYDSLDNVIKTIDEEENITNYYYDALKRRTKIEVLLTTDGKGTTPIDPSQGGGNGYITSIFGYDLNDNTEKIIDDNRNETNFVYDSLNRLKILHLADGTEIKTFFDRDNNIIKKLDPNGTEINKEYDEIHRIKKIEAVYPVSDLSKPQIRLGGTTKQTFEYDGLSRTIEAINYNSNNSTGKSVVTRKYDSLGNILEEKQSVENEFEETLKREFDDEGNEIKCEYFVGSNPNPSEIIETKYDGLERPFEIIDNGNRKIIKIDYAGSDREIQQEFSNGIKTSIKYDGNKRIIELKSFKNSNTLIDFLYEHDKVDNQTLENNNHLQNTTKYSYDSAYRLLLAKRQKNSSGQPTDTNFSYTLDGLGNRIETNVNGQTVQYNSNSVNEYESINGNQRIHDEDGNLTDDGKYLFEYDFLNRIVQIRNKTSNNLISKYLYDALGRRIKKIVGDKKTIFLYCDKDVLEERSDSLSIEKLYVIGHKIDNPIEIHTNGNIFTYHDDSLGNIISLTDSSGNIVEYYEYDPYGFPTIFENDRVTIRNNSKISNPYMFTSRQFDLEFNIYYYRARNYDPKIGRFLQREPLALDNDDLNFYTYAKNNPINFNDPEGLIIPKRRAKTEQIPDSVRDTPTGYEGFAMGVMDFFAGIVGNEGVQNISNFAAGAGDSLSGGLTIAARKMLPQRDVVDYDSTSYTVGEITATVGEIVATGGGAILRHARDKVKKTLLRKAGRRKLENAKNRGIARAARKKYGKASKEVKEKWGRTPGGNLKTRPEGLDGHHKWPTIEGRYPWPAGADKASNIKFLKSAKHQLPDGIHKWIKLRDKLDYDRARTQIYRNGFVWAHDFLESWGEENNGKNNRNNAVMKEKKNKTIELM